MNGPPVWLDYDQAALDRQYDQRTLVPDSARITDRYDVESERVRAEIDGKLDVPYGPSAEEVLDVFPAAPPGGPEGAPVLVFVHGGAWARQHKDNYSFVAEHLTRAGVAVVVTNFALVPAVTLDELVRQNRAATAWAWRNARGFGADPDRLFVAGHSSGGHVAAMLVSTDWAEFGLPADAVKGGVALSGMYDLEPVRLSARNSYLKLDAAAARRNSPIHHIPPRPVPMIVGHGDGELAEFQRHSRAYAAAWAARGYPCTPFEFAGLNHFEVCFEYARPDSALFAAMRTMMGVDPR